MSRSNPDPYEISKQIQQAPFQGRTPHRKDNPRSGIKIQQRMHLRNIDGKGLECGRGNKFRKQATILLNITQK